MKSTPWLIIGAGAVGLFWSCKLKQLGYKVHLVYRSNNPGKIIILDSVINNETDNVLEYKIKSFKSEELTKPYDKVLICTKSFDVKKAFLDNKVNITPDAWVACLCNGVGAQQQLQNELKPSQKLWVGTTSEGMLKTGKNTVKHTGLGDSFFGSWVTSSQDEHFPLDTFKVPNIHRKIFEKLAINACINPITAIFDIYNGDLLHEEYASLLDAVTTELEAIFTHEDFVYHQHSKHLTKDILQSRIHTVAHLTKLNRSSMCEDIRLNRPTEIDFISGFLLNHSPIELPIQRLLYDAVTSPEHRDNHKKRLLDIF